MPWKSESVMDQRIKFLIRAKSNQASFSELCREFEISRPTGYLWLKRYEQVGSVTGLAEKSRRPHNSPLQTDYALEKLVVAFRKKQGWGARKIQVLLAKEGHQLGSATIPAAPCTSTPSIATALRSASPAFVATSRLRAHRPRSKP